MNIIQLQDRLKGTPDQTLVGYIQNPTGEIPTYLALGELERRKTMREKYQAQVSPEQSVAEQVVKEAQPQMPQGLAMLATPPSMTPDQAIQGVASLPAENIGKNYAGGGIVAFAEGGQPRSRFDRFLDENIFSDKYIRERDANLDPYEIRAKEISDFRTQQLKELDLPGYFENLTDEEYADYQARKKAADEEYEKRKSNLNNPLNIQMPPEEPDPALVDLTKEQEAEAEPKPKPKVPEETVQAAEKAKEKIAEGKPISERERNAYLALAKAGFAMAAGSSPFALQNIGAAGMVGVEDFAASEKDRAAREVAANAALVKANQAALENKLNVDKQALDYVEGVMGKPSELDDDVRIKEREAAYQTKKLELLRDYGLISKQDAMAVLQSIQQPKISSNGFKLVQ